MKRVFTALSCALVCAPLLAQSPTPPQLQVTTGSADAKEIPKNAKPAEIQDLRRITRQLDDPYELERLGLAAVNANTLPRARRFFEESWKVGELPSAAYNIACVDLRESKVNDALAQLSLALKSGFDDE